jgi:hypothetical protein
MADDNALRRGYPFSRSNPEPAPRQSETDPLSELARLIGQTKPFGEQPRASGRDREWPGAATATTAMPLGADYRDDLPRYEPDQGYDAPQGHDHPDQHHGYTDQPPYDAQTDYGQPDMQAPYYGDNGELAPEDPYAQQQYADEEPPRRRRSGLITVAAVVALAMLGTAGAYGYRTFFSGGAPGVPPLIKADAGPNKVAASQQSGDGGNSKQIYDRVGGGGQEKIVSREEQPVDVKPANARPAYVPGSSPGAPSVAAAAQMAPAWPNPPGATVQQSAPQQGASPTEPRKVRTVTIRPDQPAGAPPASTMPPAAAPRAAAPAAESAAPAPAAAPPAPRQQVQPVPRAASNGPLSLTPQGAAAQRSASAEPRVTATAPSPVASGGGSYVVQLSAQKTEEEASAAFRAAQARYPQLLGNRQLIVRRKEIAGKGTFYGAQVGPFASRDGATQLCEDLKSAGGSCLVQKN